MAKSVHVGCMSGMAKQMNTKKEELESSIKDVYNNFEEKLTKIVAQIDKAEATDCFNQPSYDKKED